METPSNYVIIIGITAFMFFAWIILTPSSQLTITMGGMIGLTIGVIGVIMLFLFIAKRLEDRF